MLFNLIKEESRKWVLGISSIVLLIFVVEVNAYAAQSQIYTQDNAKLLAFQNTLNVDNLVTMRIDDMNLSQALEMLASRLSVGISYSAETIPEKKVSLDIANEPVFEVLYKLLERTNLEPILPRSKDVIVIREISEVTTAAILQETISGTVVDAQTGEVLPGVNVIVEGSEEITGSTIGTTTNSEGYYEVRVPAELNSLIFSYLGYQRLQITIDNRNEINVELNPDTEMLDDIVVIGYGEQSRENITGAISSVSGDDITSANAIGVQEALQGRIAGVNVTPSTGQPGAPLDINIRGLATFGNGNPLFVVDGVPVFSGSGGTNNSLATLNPENISSIEILKDASASAIYGARAANGVVLITTNRGQAGETQFSFGVSRGVSTVLNKMDMMNSQQYVDYAIEGHQNAGMTLPISLQEPLVSQNLQTDTNWPEEVFSPGISQNYNFSVSGGTEKVTYALSGGYLDQEGTIPNSAFKRYSMRINTDFNISEKFNVSQSMELSRSNWLGTFSPTSSNMQQVHQMPPTVPVYNPENLGGFAGSTIERSPSLRQNMVGEWTLQDDTNSHNRLLGNVNADYEFYSNFSYRLNVGADISFNESKSFTPRFEMGSRSNPVATLNEGRFSENTYLVENTITYQNQFRNLHDFTALVGYTIQDSWAKSLSGSTREFPSNNTRTVAASFGQTTLNGDETGWALESQIGRINYTYDNKYNLMATIRRDGSSRFGSNNRYGIFPSISGSWIVTNESFMNSINLLTNLTLRASWGKVGNQEVDNFASLATISPFSNYIFGEDAGVVPGATYLQPGNADLKWETTTQTNIGLDIYLLNERLSFIMDYYIKDTEDLLLRVPIPTSSGIRRDQGAFQNAGSIHNNGFEFTANYQNSLGDFVYRLSSNLSTNSNEVTDLGGGESIITTLGNDGTTVTTITEEGQEMGSFYGYIMDGVFRDQADLDNHATQSGAAPGDVKFRDIDGDGAITADDRTIIGSPFPDFSYGFNINLLYKNFDMSVFLQGKQGHDVYNLIWVGLNDGESINNATTEMLDRWTPNNRDTNVPRAVTGDPNNNIRPSTRFLEDGSYLRVQNVQIGYNLSSELANRLKLSGLRLYLSGKNLFTLTGYRGHNPEVGTLTGGGRSSLTRGIDFGSYPIPRTIELGMNINFN